ncbi:hypothetical protein PQX77_015226 [Marasmius sp. AFHP31]|nr:hypothetical protein PQX77_015226 [Marasmius sp. AFHP31]
MSSSSLANIDTNADDSEGVSGCEGIFGREAEDWNPRNQAKLARPIVAESLKTQFRQTWHHPTITGVSSLEDRLPSSIQPPSTLPAGCTMYSTDTGSFAGPPTSERWLGAPASANSYSPGLVWNNTANVVAESQRNGRNSRKCNEPKMNRDRGHPYARTYDTTQNDGDHNKTYQQSRVSKKRTYDKQSRSNAEVHFHVYGQESSFSAGALRDAAPSPHSDKSHTQPVTPLLSRGSTSPSISHSTPGSLPDIIVNSTPTPPFYGSDYPQQSEENDRGRTRSERYESLLLGCKLGFPLWVPSPRCTSDGEYYMPEIGDVGVLSHGLPFNTLFNITQPLSSAANKDGVPEGFDPPCVLKSRWITITERNNWSQIPLFQPKRAIVDQKRGVAVDGLSRVFTFDLSKKEGALLMLPSGSTLRNLENTMQFEERARLQWRQWYDYANGQMNPEDGRALYLVTGVERCKAWAMAAWDSSYACDKSGSLELTVDVTTGACSWAFPPARCSTEVSGSPPTQDLQSNQETVFIRGFRIDVYGQGISLCPPGLSSRPSRERDGNSDGDSNFKSGSRNPPSGDSFKPSSSSSTHYSFHGGGHFGTSDSQSDYLQRLDPPIDATRIVEVELNANLSGDSITHPCKTINSFAFELIAKTEPTLLDVGCVAFSHDEHWISTIQDSDDEFPSNVEIVQRICSKFKFTIEGSVIYTTSMTDSDKELLARRELSRSQGQDSVTVFVLVTVSTENNSTVIPTADAPADPIALLSSSSTPTAIAHVTAKDDITRSSAMADLPYAQVPQSNDRAGCWTCRIRRKRCDLERLEGDTCRTCKRLTIECLGWGAKRPEWMRNKQAVNNYKASILVQLVRKGLIRGRPRSSKLQAQAGAETAGTSTPQAPRRNQRFSVNSNGSTNGGASSTSPTLSGGEFSQNQKSLLPDLNTLSISESSSSSLLSPNVGTSSLSNGIGIGMGLGGGTGSTQGMGMGMSMNMGGGFGGGGGSGGFDYGNDVQTVREIPILSGQNLIQESHVMYYFENIRRAHFIMSNSAVMNTIFKLIVQEPRGALTNAVCALASLHYTRLRVAQGLEAPDPNPEHSTAKYFYDEALYQIFNAKQLRGGSYNETDVLAALHLVCFSQLSGGSTDWQSVLHIALDWIAQLGLPTDDNPGITLGMMNSVRQLSVKCTMIFDIISGLTLMRPPKYFNLYQRLLSWTDNNMLLQPGLRMEVLTGCPDEAWLAIAEISVLSFWKASEERKGSLSFRELVRRGDNIERHLRQQITSSTFRSTDPLQSQNTYFGTVEAAFPTEEVRRVVASIFRETSLLFLHTVVNSPSPSVPEIKTSVDSLVTMIRQLEPSDIDRTLVFPICLAGSMTDNAGHREFLKGRLQGQDETIGNVMATRFLMEGVWQKRDVSGSCIDWRELIRDRGMNLLLI